MLLRGLLDEPGSELSQDHRRQGTHVLVPLRPGYRHADVLAYAHVVADRMVSKAPELVTLSFAKTGRGRRVYIDLARNVFGATLVAPYSVRHRPHAPVSTPLTWDEVRPELDPASLNVRTIAERLAAADPWRRFWSDLQGLPSERTTRAGKRPVTRKGKSAA